MKRRAFLTAFCSAVLLALTAFRRKLRAEGTHKQAPVMPLKKLSRDDIHSTHDLAG